VDEARGHPARTCEADAVHVSSEREDQRTRGNLAVGLPGPYRDRVDDEIANAVARAQAGDPNAIRVPYLRDKDNVYGYVLSFARDEHEAGDITQHVFLNVMSVIHKYRVRGVPFTSWLMRVARNVALEHIRRRRTLPSAEVPEV
jgi:hypothetical protein